MENLRKLRIAKGLTMKELGEKVGVTESMIGMIETGKRQPGYETLLKLGEELGCSIDYLMRGKNGLIVSVYDEYPNDEAVTYDEFGNAYAAPNKKTATQMGDGKLSEKDIKLIEWFRSLPQEKQKAILTAQDAPEGLA